MAGLVLATLLLVPNARAAKVTSIYEIMPYRYLPRDSKLSPLAFIASDLERIKNLGFDTIRLLPITPVFKETAWPSIYLVMNQRAIDPEVGTAQELKLVVNRAHSLGMKVMLEWIGHNVSAASPLRQEHPEFFLRDEKNDHLVNEWQGVIFDFESQAVRDYLLESMLFWVREFGIDGYRCDVATLTPQSFWKKAIGELRALKPEFYLLAEISNSPQTGWPQVDLHRVKDNDRDPTYRLIHSGFDSVYDRSTYLLLTDAANGQKKNADDLWKELNRQYQSYPRTTEPMHFTSCHDFDAGKSSVTNFGEANSMAAALIHFLPGITLTFNGQELGIRHNILTDIKGPRIWDYPELRQPGTDRFYARLLQVKNNLGFGSRISESPITQVVNNPNVFGFMREKEGRRLVAVFNFTDKLQMFEFSNEKVSGKYRDLWDATPAAAVAVFGLHEEFLLKPWEFQFWLSDN